MMELFKIAACNKYLKSCSHFFSVKVYRAYSNFS